ncbi:MAG TPA: hypothetical protein VN851_15755 [Thermoanaerobaculia bacterium]|nr:hypothetical protein [Thermoanaerobaculia bacterium]
MRRWRGQRGEGNLGCILWAVLLAVVALIAWKTIPVKLASSEMYDFIEEQAKFAANSPDAELKKQILLKASQLGIELSPDRVSVERLGDRIRMKADYQIPVEFPGYTYVWKFHHEVDRPIFIF